MEHLRFSGLIQWGHLRQAFQGLFRPWEDLGGPEKDREFVLLSFWVYCGADESADEPGWSLVG